MITEENKQLAQWAMDYALKHGAQQARLVLYTESTTSFDLRDGVIDRLQQASESGLGVSLFVDGRYGTYSTNRLHQEELKRFLLHGIEHTRYLAKDPCRQLPDASRYYRGDLPDLKQFDVCFLTYDPDEKVALARAVAEEALGKDERIISVESSYSDGESGSYRIASNGFEGERRGTCFALSASVALRGEGEARPSGFSYITSLRYDLLPKEGYGQLAYERALRKIGQRKAPSGRYTMVVDAFCVRQLLSPMVSALYGPALHQQNSFLLNSLGKQVGSPLFTLLDEPHLIGANGARYFDGEGVATRPMPVFDAGALRTYYIDTYSACKMKVEPTIASPSLLVLSPGEKSQEELIADVAHGLFVTAFNGGNCNSSTGDFSYGIEGFLIEQGRLTQPVSEMVVTGNMLDLWQQLVAVGNDPRLESNWRIPTLTFEGINASGC